MTLLTNEQLDTYWSLCRRPEGGGSWLAPPTYALLEAMSEPQLRSLHDAHVVGSMSTIANPEWVSQNVEAADKWNRMVRASRPDARRQVCELLRNEITSRETQAREARMEKLTRLAVLVSSAALLVSIIPPLVSALVA